MRRAPPYDAVTMQKVRVSGKSLLIIAVIGLLALPFLWRLTLEPILTTRASWEGTIESKREKRRGQYGTIISYLWTVKCRDGKTRTVRVSRNLYLFSRPNQEVRKLKGERWPRIRDLEGRGHPLIREKLPKDAFPDPPE